MRRYNKMSSKEVRNGKTCCICSTVIIVLSIVIAVVVALIVVYVTRQSSDSDSDSQSEVSFNLHVNPSDPVIVTAETPEGDLISALGNKSTSGEPQTIDEFIVENNEDGSTFVFMNGDGTVESGRGRDGLRIDFTWPDDNDSAIIYTSIIVNNGSQQLSIRINLTEPVDPENFTNFMSEINRTIQSQPPFKRSVNNNGNQPKTPPNAVHDFDALVKRQSGTQTSNYANVFVNVKTCDAPEPNARVFADILVDYDRSSGSFDRKVKYWGTKSMNPGEHIVQIPTSKASAIDENLGNICDNVNMILGKICETYSRINDFTKLWTRHDADSLICFYVGKGLRLVYPALRLIPIHRLCKNIFKPFKAYCKYGDNDITGNGESLVDLICENLPLLDNGIDFLREEDILFTPTAIFPLGKQVQATGQVVTIPPGTSDVSQQFTITDGDALRITEFSVVPDDPLPGENYVVTVSYNCYLTSNFSANMFIVGTDNYTDTQICYTGPTCVLYVPGAEALVRDDVDIYIRNGRSSTSRMVVIIF